MAGCTQSIHDSLKTTFVALIIQSVFGVFKLSIILINCVVCQMNEHVINVCLV
jgi:hypothetical protein